LDPELGLGLGQKGGGKPKWVLTQKYKDFKTLLTTNTNNLEKYFKKMLIGFEQEF
jgi:hypothetical protein